MPATTNRCVGCGFRPCNGMCEACKSERRRIDALHDFFARYAFCSADAAVRAERVKRYRELAAEGRPLFDTEAQ